MPTARIAVGMKKFRVSFCPRAEADLFDLYRHIAEEGGYGAAGAYIDRIEATCMSLQTFPERGTKRDDLRPGGQDYERALPR